MRPPFCALWEMTQFSLLALSLKALFPLECGLLCSFVTHPSDGLEDYLTGMAVSVGVLFPRPSAFCVGMEVSIMHVFFEAQAEPVRHVSLF